MKLKQREFFKEKLGVPLKNPYWSWGAIDPDSNRVFLRLWKNQVENRGNTQQVLVLGNDWNKHANGYPERLRHISAIEAGAEGIGILCEPRISKDDSWHIRDYDDETLVRLANISRKNGAIYANIVGQVKVSDLTKGSAQRGKSLPQRLARIAYNSKNWNRPSGDAKKHETPGTYNNIHGFGHEEWLFRSEWQIDGWRYAFIQGVNKSERKLVEANEALDLTLFTIQPDARRRYVAVIKEVECLGDQMATEAVKIFKKAGWFDQMLAEINDINGDVDALGNSPKAKHILNIRFRLENVIPCERDDFANESDPIFGLTRYQLFNLADIDYEPATALRRRQGTQSAPTGKTVHRKATAAIEYTPEHSLMQNQLLNELNSEFPGADIKAEEDFVDVRVRSKSELLLFEIKSDLVPRTVIRQALGQILEYAYHPQRSQKLPVRMIIVGRRQLADDDKNYLALLRDKFGLPLEYRVLEI